MVRGAGAATGSVVGADAAPGAAASEVYARGGDRGSGSTVGGGDAASGALSVHALLAAGAEGGARARGAGTMADTRDAPEHGVVPSEAGGGGACEGATAGMVASGEVDGGDDSDRSSSMHASSPCTASLAGVASNAVGAGEPSGTEVSIGEAGIPRRGSLGAATFRTGSCEAEGAAALCGRGGAGRAAWMHPRSLAAPLSSAAVGARAGAAAGWPARRPWLVQGAGWLGCGCGRRFPWRLHASTMKSSIFERAERQVSRTEMIDPWSSVFFVSG